MSKRQVMMLISINANAKINRVLMRIYRPLSDVLMSEKINRIK
jgi:hypothetical protein